MVQQFKRRASFQRERILTLLEGGGHWSAEEIYEYLKPEIPTLSLATVYRNLKVLEEEGKVRQVALEGRDHRLWEATKHPPHVHFVCVVCGRIEDVPVRVEQLEAALPPVPGRVQEFRGTLYGICRSCLEREHAGSGSSP